MPTKIAVCEYVEGAWVPLKPSKRPTSLPKLVDWLYEFKDVRFAAKHAYDELEAVEKQVVAYLKVEIPKSKGQTGVSGKLARFEVSVSETPKVPDWSAAWAWMKKHDALDMLQKRLNVEAWKVRVADKVKMPFIETEKVLTHSLTKL